MSLAIATALGILFTIGTYLTLRQDIIRVVIGALILSQSANIFLIAMSGPAGRLPILSHGASETAVTDPVPQALVLTAIVIGFASTAFILSLTYRLYEETETVTIDDIRRQQYE